MFILSSSMQENICVIESLGIYNSDQILDKNTANSAEDKFI